ncbi:antibiotic biosynthesis monooxygenase [Bacterioplanes sanyensis]|uniref:Antibiotic biosynthesis monooxygenase n=1 Tax=Bacterioplanes sanyensis TaxID=1249553 RepID=A0A222FIY5_9GAMM|nr:antibiotic biosynthesis monooxygenase [Bacterioplanes sanyensis]ASP38556.1 antibiotic biosynthesis monooxygenase [Bacterioplanes sanyensis]
MTDIAQTPPPPYYAVIFSNERTSVEQGYEDTAERMMTLAKLQPGFLGVESVRHGLGITVSYWQSLEAIRQWKQNAEHLQAQRQGREQWYDNFTIRIAKVEREYSL